MLLCIFYISLILPFLLYRNLLEREKLQNQLTELTSKVQQQNDTISTLQRRIALEAKNFKHQLQSEINKHKDTRHDLDLAISNADKLSTIIEVLYVFGFILFYIGIQSELWIRFSLEEMKYFIFLFSRSGNEVKCGGERS